MIVHNASIGAFHPGGGGPKMWARNILAASQTGNFDDTCCDIRPWRFCPIDDRTVCHSGDSNLCNAKMTKLTRLVHEASAAAGTPRMVVNT